MMLDVELIQILTQLWLTRLNAKNRVLPEDLLLFFQVAQPIASFLFLISYPNLMQMDQEAGLIFHFVSST